jgi:hypothetical protein
MAGISPDFFAPKGYGYGKKDEPKEEPPKTPEEQIHELYLRVMKLEDVVSRMPQPEEYGRELPIVRLATDKYFKWQKDGVNLTLMLNREQLQRDQVGGGGGGSEPLYIKIDSAAETGVVDARGNPVQWLYQGTQVVKGLSGYGNLTWVAATDGYVGSVRNMCENGNTGISVQDNGVDFDAADFPEGFEMIPIVVGDVVELFFVTNSAGDKEAWFDRCNAVDGLCSGSFPNP